MAASPTFRPSAFKSHTQVQLDDHYLIALAKHPIVDQYDLSSLVSILSGAAPLP